MRLERMLFAGCLLLLSGCVGDMGGVEDEDSSGEDQDESQLSTGIEGQARPFGYVMGDSRRIRELLAGQGGPGQLPPEEEVSPASTVCPGSTVTKGIDVSYYQGTITWSSVKSAGKKFAMVRVSDGTGFLDPKFATNWKNAKAAGVVVGAYQFFEPSQDPTSQADLVVSQLKSVGYNASTDIAPVIDVEITGGQSSSTVASRVNTWLSRIKSKLGGTPILYTSPGFWSSIGNPTPNPKPNLWDAHWTSGCPTIPPNWSTWKFWQYSSSGSVSGISGAVDLDEFNGSSSSVKNY